MNASFYKNLPSKNKAKISHDHVIQTYNLQNQLIAYNNKSKINNKIDIATVLSL